MRGASRASLAAAKERLSAALADVSAGQASDVGEELFAIVGLLDREPGLRRGLSDPAKAANAKVGLACSLLSGKVSEITLALVSGLVTDRWSEAGDLADAAEELAVLAIAEAANRQG